MAATFPNTAIVIAVYQPFRMRPLVGTNSSAINMTSLLSLYSNIPNFSKVAAFGFLRLLTNNSSLKEEGLVAPSLVPPGTSA